MTTGYISNELCVNPISTLPVVSLHADLNGEATTNLPGIQVDENLTDSHNGPVLIHTLPAADGLNIQTIDRSLPVDYITLPVATSVSYICRLCATVIDFDSAVSLFPNDGFEENVACKINKYLPIVVYESDPFPKTVCKTCVSKLNQFHDLAEKCVSVEEQFRQSYVYDERYLNEVTKKINQKSNLDPTKQNSENTPQSFPTQDFQYVENLGDNNLNPNTCKDSDDKKEDELNQHENNLKEVNYESDYGKSEDEDSLASEQTNCEKDTDILDPKFCGANLKDLDDCMKHSLSHVESVSNDHLPCSICCLSFESKTEWESHIKTHFDTNSQQVKITHAPREKEKAKQIKRHRSRKNSEIICCKKCKEELDSVDTAVEHCLKHKPANFKSYPCVLCVRIIGKYKLKDHVSLHYMNRTKPILTCDVCNNLYPDEKTLRYHRCMKLRKYKCSQCKQGFKSEDRLKFHEDFHKNKSTFCDICKKDFKFESRMYLHFAGVHNGIREKPYCCDVCGKTFTWLTLLNSHKRIHTNERPYKCAKCDARFCSKYSLTGHMPSHEDHPQFHCDKCEYYTSRKLNLLSHINRFHKEIKSSQTCIQCKICNEIFPNKHHMDVEEHFSKHSLDEDSSMVSFTDVESEEVITDPDTIQELVATKLYQCERCDRCYISLEHLTEHRTTHADDDPSSIYHCRLCDSGFPKHDLLVKHLKLHVNISSQYTETLSVLTVIICDICGIECVDYRQLLNHKDRGNCMNKKINGTVRPKKVLVQKHLKPLKSHQLFINSDGLFECPTCQKTYKSRRRYRLHLATHTNTSLKR